MNLLKALATISSFTLLSRISGFIRDTLIARIFGAGLYTDAFFVAFKLPNLLRRLFAEGAFSQAFVPILAEYRNKQGEDATRRLASEVASILTLALIAIALLGVLGAPALVYISAPGFAAEPAKFDATVLLTRITFPYICFISLVALSAGVLNTWSRFSVPAFTPVLLNVAMIVAATVLAPHFNPPVLALAWGVLLGGALQLGLQIPALLRIGMLPRPTLDFSDPGVRRILTLMGPATLGVSVAQISLLINTIFASFLGTGSVSWLYYADRLMEFPTGMLGVALGTTLLVNLPRAPLLLGLGLFVLVFALRSLFNLHGEKPVSRWWALPASLTGGTVGALFGTGGPPYVIYLAHRLRDKSQLRATLSGVFLLEGMVRIATFVAAGLLLQPTVWRGYAWGLTVALLALYGGSHIHMGLDQTKMTRLIGSLLLLSSLSLFAKALI